MSRQRRESDGEVESLNRAAVAGLVVSFFVAVAGLFSLPVLTTLGLDSRTAFWLVIGVEFLAAVGVGLSVRALYR